MRNPSSLLTCLGRPILAALALLLSACAFDKNGVYDYPLYDSVCSQWSQERLLISLERERLAVGQRSSAHVSPGLPAECDPLTASVTWRVDDASIAALTRSGSEPGQYQVGITGLSPGSTMVRARIVFSGGAVQEVQPRLVTVR